MSRFWKFYGNNLFKVWSIVYTLVILLIPKHQKLDKWAMAGEKRQICWPKIHIETEYESQLTVIR